MTIKERYEHFLAEQRRYSMTHMREDHWCRRSFYAFVCFIAVVYDEVMSSRLFIRSSSTAYTTMLALIPFLIVGGSFVLMFNKMATISELIGHINDAVIPSAGDSIAGFLTDSLERTLDLGLGPVGVIALFVTSVMLFIHIEDTINDIWHVRRARAFHLRILLFYAVVTLGPVLFSFSIYQGAQIIADLDSEFGIWKLFGSRLTTFFVFFVLFKFVPNTRVKMLNAIIPAVVVGILFEVMKYLFTLYMTMAFKSSYSILYGAIGLIPLILVWVYVIWTLTYLGVEACYCSQNFHHLMLRRLYENPTSNQDHWIFIGAYAPLEVLSVLVRDLCNDKSPSPCEDISTACRYPIVAVEAVLERLSGMGITKSVDGEFSKAYFLSRPLDAITINEVMRAFDESSPRVNDHPRLQKLVTQLLEAQRAIWADTTANDLREDDEEEKKS